MSAALARHPPFQPYSAAVLLSGAIPDLSPLTKPPSDPALAYENFNNFATAMGCTGQPGEERLGCLRAVPAEKIEEYVNGNETGPFGFPLVDK